MRILYMILFLLICRITSGQIIISQQVFASGGTSGISPSMSINGTLGESFIFGNMNSIVSFHQGFNSGILDQSLSTIGIEHQKYTVRYYPNPAYNFLNLKWDPALLIHYVLISDMQDIIVRKEKVLKNSEIQLQLPKMAPGTYSIKFITERGHRILAGYFIHQN